MVPFSLETPSRVIFGAGALSELPGHLPHAGRRVLVVSGSKWFEGSGTKRKLEKLLEGRLVGHLACREGEPSTDSIAEVRDGARAFSPDVIVGIGGGSVLDTAKVASALLPLDGLVDEYLEGVEGGKRILGPGIPWIAVPTTAGTGAEATKNAVVKSSSLGVKRSMRSPFLLASSAIVDPAFSSSLPLSLTGICGLDALTQLVESYVSRRSTPPVRVLVRDAFVPLLQALERLPRSPSDIELRSDSAYGALVSGFALTNAGLGAAHGFAAGIGGAYEIPHGLICAVFLPHVLEANADAIGERTGELVGRLARGRDPVEWLSGKTEALLEAYGLPTDLRRYGIPKDRVAELAEKSSGSSMRGNPRDLSMEEKQRLISRVI